jgi:hypothetical protein
VNPNRIACMTDAQIESSISWLVNRSHVSVSDKGIRSTIGRKLKKEIVGDDRKRFLDAASRIHKRNQDFFKAMRF